MKKVLTISIAAYNVEETLERALNSLLCVEDFVDKLEIIIENDGSSDRTQEIAEHYKKRYPDSIIVNNKKNGGYGSTINESIRMASGKYFKQLDGDDWFESSNVRAFIEYLACCNSDLVYSPHYIIKQYEDHKNKTLINVFDNYFNTDIELSKESLSEDLGMHGLTIKTELLKKNNIEISEKCFYTDFEYVFYPFVFAERLSIFILPVYNYLLGRDGQSVSLTGEKKHYKDRISVFMRAADYYEQNQKNINGNKRVFLGKKISNLAGDMYNSILLIVERQNQKDFFTDIDNKIKKQYPEVYRITNNRKSVMLLRKLRFSIIGRAVVKGRIIRRYK